MLKSSFYLTFLEVNIIETCALNNLKQGHRESL